MDPSLPIDASALLSALGRLADVGQSPEAKEGLRDAASAYMESMAGRYVANSGGGGEWPPLAPATILARSRRIDHQRTPTARRLSQGGRFPILIDRGRLYASMTRGNAGYVEEETSGGGNVGVTVGTSVPYAAAHQSGGGRLPRRAVLVEPDPQALETIRQKLADAVARAVERIWSQG